MESWLVTLYLKRGVLRSYLHKATFSSKTEELSFITLFPLKGLEVHYKGLLQVPSAFSE